MKKITLIFAVFFFAAGFCLAQIPQTISYQGVLKNVDGTPITEETYTMTFNLYNVPDGGAPLWSEERSVAVRDGMFNVILGINNPIDILFNEQYWLGVTVGEDSELTPRIQLTSSAYSFIAKSVADSAVTGSKIAYGNVVRSINSLSDHVTIVGDSTVTITADGDTLTISASTPIDGDVVKSINSLTDDVIISPGANISISTSGNNLIISAIGLGQGDINDVIAGMGMTGGGTSGSVTVSIDTEGASTGQAIIFDGSDVVWDTPAGLGDITGVTAGQGLTGGGSSGEVTVSIDTEGASEGDAIIFDGESVTWQALGNGVLENGYITEVYTDEGLYSGREGSEVYIGLNVDSGLMIEYGEDEDSWLTLDMDYLDEEYVSYDAEETITSSMIMDGEVYTDEIAEGAVTLDKINADDVSSGYFIMFDGGEVVWNEPPELTLPYSGDESGASDAFSVTKTGADGTAGTFTIDNAENNKPAVYAETNGTSETATEAPAVRGVTTGTGQAGLFQIMNAESSNSALKGETNGTGQAGYFQINNADNTSSALYATTDGSGYAGEFGGDVYVSGNVSVGTATATNILTIQQTSETDPVADAWTTYSSRRWKTNINTIENPLDKVKRLHGVMYDWKADGKHDIGLIAEEVGEVIPEVVVYEENGVYAQSVDYARLVSVLIEAMKEQQEMIDELTAKVAALENK